MPKRDPKTVWSKVPRIQMISKPMPDAPYMPLTGGGTANMPLSVLLLELELAIKREDGSHYFAYIWDGDKELADTYCLEWWEVFTPPDGSYDAMIVLYYAPLNQYETLLKHFGEDSAKAFLAENAAYQAIAELDSSDR